MDSYSLWDNRGIIRGETILFTDRMKNVLAYPVRKILKVCNETLNICYEEGKDWSFRNEILEIPENSRIHVVTENEYFPDPNVPGAIPFPETNSNLITGASGSPTGALLFGLHDLFARLQVSFDYETDPALLPEIPGMPSGKIPEIREKSTRTNLTFLFIGDSITAGYNSSGMMNVPPHLPCYAARTAEYFHAEYHNYAVGGTASPQGLDQLECAIRDKVIPDLVFIAFGMNELHSTPGTFRGNLLQLTAKARSLSGDPGIVFVSPMCGSELWDCTSHGNAAAFAEVMRGLAAGDSRIVFADVNALWLDLMRKKKFLDLTGNGVNHPNDFGYTLYTMCLTRTLAALKPDA